MISKKTFLKLIIGIVFIQLTHSQAIIRLGEDITRSNNFRVKSFDHFNMPTKGSPYLYKDRIAEVSLLTKTCSINFDAYNNQMEINKDGKTYYLPRNNFNYTINFTNINKTYKLFKYETNKEIKPGFFLCLVKKNNAFLLKKEWIKKYEAKKATHGYEKSTPITFKRMKGSHYLCFDNINAIKTPSSKKQFKSLFKKNKKEISIFMKKNNLNHKKEQDLIKIFNYYASIN